MDSGSGFGRNIERTHTVQIKCTFCGGVNNSTEKKIKWVIREKKKSRAAGDLDNRKTERTHRKMFICGYEDHIIEKYPKP